MRAREGKREGGGNGSLARSPDTDGKGSERGISKEEKGEAVS